MRYRLQRHDGTDCSATMVPITVLRMVPIQRYRHQIILFRKFHFFLIRRIATSKTKKGQKEEKTYFTFFHTLSFK